MPRRATAYENRAGKKKNSPSHEARAHEAINKETRGISVTALWQDQAKYNAHAEIEETVAEHVIPRQSQGSKQNLAFFPLPAETIEIKTRQLDRSDPNYRLVETTDRRTIKRAERTLLNTRIPDRMPAGFMRETARSKRRVWRPEPLPAFEAPAISPDLGIRVGCAIDQRSDRTCKLGTVGCVLEHSDTILVTEK